MLAPSYKFNYGTETDGLEGEVRSWNDPVDFIESPFKFSFSYAGSLPWFSVALHV